MKASRHESGGIVFVMAREERDFVTMLLQQYPTVPHDHYKLSREGAAGITGEDEEMLQEIRSEETQANRQRLTEFLQTAFDQEKRQHRLTILADDAEWFLSILNDIRVGHWLKAGSPDTLDLGEITPETPHFQELFIVDVCGALQSLIISSLEE